MGHRDSTPEYAEEYAAWTNNFITVSRANHERWGWPKEVVDTMEAYFKMELEIIQAEDAIPVEPGPIDGYTIYWDEKKRFRELICAYLQVPCDEDGGYDLELLVKRMLAEDTPLAGWQDFLMGIVRENAARYGMSDEWAEAVKRRMEEGPQPSEKDKGPGMEQQLLMLYRLR